KGDLYCKNCFLRIFSREGKYSSFGDKTLPQQGGAAGGAADRSRSNTGEQSNPMPGSASQSGSFPSASAARDASHSASSSSSSSSAAPERRASVVLTCVVADCKGARVPRKNYCLEHLQSGESNAASLVDLIDA